MKNPVVHNPVMSAIVGLLVAGGGLLAAFGVNLTPAQIAALAEFAQAALALGLLVRSQVTPKAHLAPPGPPKVPTLTPVNTVPPPPEQPAPAA